MLKIAKCTKFQKLVHFILIKLKGPFTLAIDRIRQLHLWTYYWFCPSLWKHSGPFHFCTGLWHLWMSLGINYTGVQSFNLYRIEGNYVLPPQTRDATIKNWQHASSTVIIPRTYGIGEAGKKHWVSGLDRLEIFINDLYFSSFLPWSGKLFNSLLQVFKYAAVLYLNPRPSSNSSQIL